MIEVKVPPFRTAAILFDEPKARYPISKWLHASCAATPEAPESSTARYLVEVQRFFGGAAPRAMIGGVFQVDSGDGVRYRVGIGDPVFVADEARRSCPSGLWSQSFAPGLPAEYAQAVCDGIVGHEGRLLPTGELIVDRAGFDVAESSSMVFRQAAELLRVAVASSLQGADVKAEVRASMENW